MRRFRSGLLALGVVFVTAFSLVGTTAPAWAYDSSCVGGSWFCAEGREGLFGGTGLSLDDFRQSMDDLAGWAPGSPSPGCTPERPIRLKEGPCTELLEGYAVGPGGAVRTLGSLGTAQEVKAGTALSARLCATGSACRSVLGWFGRSLDDMTKGPKVLDVAPSDANIDTGVTSMASLAAVPVQQYPTAGTPGATVEWSISKEPLDWAVGQNIGVKYTSLTNEHNMCVQWAVDFVVKATGVWDHENRNECWTVGPSPGERSFWTMGVPRQDVEIRRVHMDESQNYGEARADKGFRWGQDLQPEGSRNQVTVRCQASDGTETDAVGEAVLSSMNLVVTPSCPPGTKPLWAQLDTVLPDGSRVNQSIQNLRPLDPATRPPSASSYPLCADGSCIWIIKVGDTWCAKGVAGCTDWAERPEEAKCFLGPYEQPLTRCGWLERVYENNPSPIPATGPNVDGKPGTREGPTRVVEPAPAATPAPGPTRPPATATPKPTATPTGSPTATPSPSGSPEPCTAGQACGTSPETPEAGTERCFPTGWAAANPVEWVKKPVGCALREAFIPDPAVVTEVTTGMRTDLGSSGVADISSTLGQPFEVLGSGSGCDGIQFDLPIGGQSFHGSILNACSGPMATAAHISSALVGLSVVLGGGMALLRLAGAGFGYNVKVSDGD